MKKTLAAVILLCAFCLPTAVLSQAGRTLNADGRTDTYQLIESYGYGVEVPDCGHPVKHITQQYDAELGRNVLVFSLHAELDDDRCGAQDRQRAEIKTFGPSPESMKGHRGKTHTYRWKFRLDKDFQPSPYFCHIHQVKADAGPQAGAPIVTLTPRLKNEGEVLQFNVVSPENHSTILAEVDLELFKGTWVEVTETILHDSPGFITMEIRRVSDGELLLHGESGCDLWREGARFNRPKYGIYRSLREGETYLRDESVLFADIEFIEVAGSDPANETIGWERASEIINALYRPVFADRIIRVVDFGASGDNLHDNTQAFDEAIRACHAAGGGKVEVPEGYYLIRGDLKLLSGVKLEMSDRATLYFSGTRRGLLKAEGGGSIAITGGRIGGDLPGTVSFSGCEGILLEGLTLSDGWNVAASRCTNITLDGLEVTADGTAIAVETCSDMLIENCDLSSGGDLLALSSEGTGDGIIIKGNYFRKAPGSAIVMGRESGGTIRQVFVSGNVFGEISEHIVFIDPAGHSPVTVEEVRMRSNRSEGYPCLNAFRLDQTRYKGDPAQPPVIWYMWFEDITGINVTGDGIVIRSIPRTLRPVESIWFENIQLRGADNLLVKEGWRDVYLRKVGEIPSGIPDSADSERQGAGLDYAPGSIPEFWSVAAARSTIERWPDYSQAYYNAWTYVNGYMFCAFERLYQATGDRTYLEYIKNYVDLFIDEQGNFRQATNNKGITRIPSYCDNLDGMMAGNSVVMMYEYFGDEKYKLAARNIRECLRNYPRNSDGGFWHNERLDGQMWIDGIFMGQMFLLRYGRSIDEAEYTWDEAIKQIVAYSKTGEKGDSGLYVHGVYESGHGPRECPWADPLTGQSCDVWGEGLGWYALAIVEALETIPQDYPGYGDVRDIFVKLAGALVRTQDPVTGGWYQVVDRGDDPENWIETSGTAMFTYALRKGIDLGILPAARFDEVVRNGYRSMTAHARINSKGLVDIYEACDGVGVQTSYDKYIYNNRRSVNAKEAVVGFVWAAEIVEREAIKKYYEKD